MIDIVVPTEIGPRHFTDPLFVWLLETVPDALVCVDSGGRIVLVNAQAERMFGYRREELKGQLVEILVPDAMKAGHPARRAGYAADPRPRPMGAGVELTGRRRDGSIFPAEIALAAIDTDDGILVSAAIRDVSERRELLADRKRLKMQAERDRIEHQHQQLHGLESLGQLAGGVAHDFNNLLAVILNYATFVSEDVARELPQTDWLSIRDDVQQIQIAAERAVGLTHQLLVFARREVVQPCALYLNDVIGGIEPLLVRTLGEHVELSTDLSAGVGPVLVDPSQLEQVLLNLAINARDAMPGGGSLTIHTASTEMNGTRAEGRSALRPGRYATLKVTDSGTGMPREVVDRAFEPFFSTKAKGHGSGLGLGLATVYGIVTQAHGYVQIHSEPGVGTAFTIVLPETSQPVAEPSAQPQAAEGTQGETVLVVEDEIALREATRRILARNGYQVITAANGRDAIEAASSHPGGIDLLVTDVIMPEMSGKEAADRIQALYPSVRVLFMSGYSEGILSAEGVLETGINLLEKPFTEKSLLAMLREVITLAPGQPWDQAGGPPPPPLPRRPKPPL
jgi:PAS domain S-box-containing protein